MGPIQSGINQSMSILGLMATQTARFKNYQEVNKLKKDYKNLEKAGESILNETKSYLENSNIMDERQRNAMKTKMDLAYSSTTDPKTGKEITNPDTLRGQSERILKELALKGNKEAFNKLTSPEYIEAPERAKLARKILDVEYRTVDAQDSLNASQMEKRNSNVDLEHITDYRDKIWNYDIDYEPVLKQTYDKVKNIVEKENK